MGYRKIPTIYTLDKVKDADGLIVRIKSIKIGKLRKVMAETSEDKDTIGGLEEVLSVLAESLVSWNLEDENGTPVPATLAGLEDQDIDFVMALMDSWLDNLTGPSEELGKDSSSGSQFPGQPVTMEAL